ncbi:MAG: OmpH family outer membrane protein [Bacteroidales bacterium]
METKGKIQTTVSLVLALAIIVLYVLHFRAEQEESPAGDPERKQGLRIGYVNTDSVLSQYEMVRVMESKLEGEGEAMRNELQRRDQSLRQKIQEYQQNVQRDAISMEEAKRTEEALMKEQEELYKLQEEYASQYADQTMGMNQELVDTVKRFLHRYNRDSRFDYILAKSEAKNNILFARDTFDITADIIGRMNEEYRKQKEE